MVSFILAYYSHIQIWIFTLIAFLYIFYIYFKNKAYVKIYMLFGILASILMFSLLIFKKFIVPTLVPEGGGKTILHYIILNFHFTLLTMIFVSGMIFLISKNFGIFKKENNFYLSINFFVPLLILSSFPWRDARYAFFIYPFLLIIASKILDYSLIRNGFENDIIKIFDNLKLNIANFNNVKNICIILIITLLASELAFNSDSINYKQYSFQGQIISQKSSQFLKDNLGSDDKVVSTAGTLVNLYYIGRLDYLIRQTEYKRFDKNGSDIYSGAIILKSYDSFIQMVQQEQGWIISPRGVLNEPHIVDPKVRNYIRNNMTYHPEASDDITEVYSWGGIRLNNI
ncbi:Alg9-like mannosyltransferase family protein [Candidatus Methanoperedens nitroreducens]|uniref:Alg9-like mannosyltransferase family protein n=2 Tax=Candidatus Methanoperedens nitratireducens TaxID=1392998 RepID=A0A062UZE1_9EURY|nr:Alg9-like mannosyltransferase family protein [Candidatus Methanoperedens nitroreducens]